MEPDAAVDTLARTVIGAAIEVHRVLGPGYVESIYEEALSTEFALMGIQFDRQKIFSLSYKNRRIGDGRMDFLVGGRLVVEIKAVERLLPIHRAQVMSYLKATSGRLGLLINFNERLLKSGIQRIVWSSEVKSAATLQSAY
jgi:GxxExxY protein